MTRELTIGDLERAVRNCDDAELVLRMKDVLWTLFVEARGEPPSWVVLPDRSPEIGEVFQLVRMLREQFFPMPEEST
jgi:hypothetical protein